LVSTCYLSKQESGTCGQLISMALGCLARYGQSPVVAHVVARFDKQKAPVPSPNLCTVIISID
jgi:hypothetical protein